MAGNAPFDGPSGATGQVDARQQYVIESQQFHEGSAVAVGCGGDLYVVLPEIVQHLVDVCHFALAGNLYPEQPVAVETESGVTPIDRNRRFAENDHAGVVYRVASQHVGNNECVSLPHVTHFASGIGFFHAFLHRVALGIDEAAFGIGQCAGGFPVELLHTRGEKVGLGKVVTLGNPYIFALRQLEPSLPLHECRAAVLLVIHDVGDFLVAAVTLYDLPGVVGRTVVENDDFKIAPGLCQYRVDAFLQVGGMTVVGYDDRDFCHISEFRVKVTYIF